MTTVRLFVPSLTRAPLLASTPLLVSFHAMAAKVIVERVEGVAEVGEAVVAVVLLVKMGRRIAASAVCARTIHALTAVSRKLVVHTV